MTFYCRRRNTTRVEQIKKADEVHCVCNIIHVMTIPTGNENVYNIYIDADYYYGVPIHNSIIFSPSPSLNNIMVRTTRVWPVSSDRSPCKQKHFEHICNL